MKNQLVGYLVFFCLMVPLPSLAGFHLEPYAGLGVAFSGNPGDKENKVTWALKGDLYRRAAIGARAGYTKLGLAFGLDMSGSYYSSLRTLKPENFFTALPGVFVSYKLPLLFRAYGVLIPHGFFIKQEQEIKSLKKSSTPIRGVKLGISYLSVPFLSINFEYQPLYLVAAKGSQGGWLHSGTAYLNLIF